PLHAAALEDRVRAVPLVCWHSSHLLLVVAVPQTARIGGLFDLLDHPEILREVAARDVVPRHPEVAVVGPIGTPGVPALEVQLAVDRLLADGGDPVAAATPAPSLGD